MITSDRQYRAFDFKIAEESAMIVEGYAAVFDQETVLFELDETIIVSRLVEGNYFDYAKMLTKIIRDVPFPIPLSVILSPIHTRIAVPAVKAVIAVKYVRILWLTKIP